MGTRSWRRRSTERRDGMRKLVATLAVAVAAVAGVLAQEGTKAASETKLTLGGVWVLQFRVAAGGYAPERRLSILQYRVVQVLSREELRPGHVRVVPGPGGKSASIYVGSLLLVTVTQADAEASRSTPVTLAGVWANNFRRGFAAARPRPIPPQQPAGTAEPG
jgi:hypothetical protein